MTAAAVIAIVAGCAAQRPDDAGAELGPQAGLKVYDGLGVGLEVRPDCQPGVGLGVGVGAECALLPGVLVVPLPLLGLGPLALGLGSYVSVLLPLPLLPLPVLGVGTLAEPPPPPPPEVGPDAELVGVRTAGPMAGALPNAPGLVKEDDGAEAGPVGLPVAGVRGTMTALPGVAPDGVGGTETSLCKHPLVFELMVLVSNTHDCLQLHSPGAYVTVHHLCMH